MGVRRRSARLTNLPEVARLLMLDEPVPPDLNDMRAHILRSHAARHPSDTTTPGGMATLGAYWQACGDVLVEGWAENAPGTRPSTWWWCASPRWSLFPDLGEPRRNVAGSGVMLWDRYPGWTVRAHQFAYGVPKDVLDVRPGDPLQWESQAAYLARQGLLIEGERKRLDAADFQPVLLAA